MFAGIHDHDPVTDGPAGWPSALVGSLHTWDAGVLWRDIKTRHMLPRLQPAGCHPRGAEVHDADVQVC
jgi:hypothetical protein